MKIEESKEFNYFKREVKNLLILLKRHPKKSIIINQIDDFIDFYYK
jgi:hypothetical protein